MTNEVAAVHRSRPVPAAVGPELSEVQRMIASGGVPLRISNTWAVVLGLAVLGLFGMIVALAFAGWEAEAIGAVFLGLAGLVGAITAAIRKSEVVEAKTDRQSVQLGRIEQQTNGESDKRVAAAVIAELRRQGIIG